MANKYVKLSFILPKNKKVKDIRKFPIIDGFKATSIEVFVRPEQIKNKNFHVVDVYLVE